MAYAQWIEIRIVAENCSLQIKDASLEWGKFYKKDGEKSDQDTELKPDEIDKIQISSGRSAYVCSCGRESASSGTEGSFNIYDGEQKVTHVKWDCPWSGQNSRSHESDSEAYGITMTGGTSKSGSIGEVTVIVFKK